MTPAALAKEILRLHRAGEALNISAVRKNHPDLLDAAYAFRPFLGWKQAIEEAGLDYRFIRIELDSEIACLICGKYFSNLNPHLLHIHGISVDDYRKDFPGAPVFSEEIHARLFSGGGGNVMEPHWEPVLSMEYILDRAWFWYDRHGLCHRGFIRFNDHSLISYCQKRKIPWDEVIRSIGLDLKEVRGDTLPDISREEIAALLRERHLQGIPNTDLILCKELPGVWDAMHRHFGSLVKALEESGLPGNHKMTGVIRARRLSGLAAYPNPASVVDALRTLADRGASLDHETVMKADPALGSAIYAHFPDYIAALRVAGLYARHRHRPKKFRRDRSNIHGRYPSAEQVVAALRDRFLRGLSILLNDVVREDPPLKSAAFTYCGSWQNAIHQAGLEEERRRIVASRVRKDAVYASAQAVRRALVKRAREGLPLAQNQVVKDDYPLKSAAYRYFGSWPAAIEAAGLTERWERQKTAAFRARNPAAYPTRLSIIEAFKERAAAGHSLAYADVNRDSPLLRSKTYEFFPSWPAAIKAAGLTRLLERQKLASRPYAAYPSRGAVIKAAKQRVVAGLPLTHTALRRDDPALQSALHHFFGPSWNAAIRQVIAPS